MEPVEVAVGQAKLAKYLLFPPEQLKVQVRKLQNASRQQDHPLEPDQFADGFLRSFLVVVDHDGGIQKKSTRYNLY